MNSICKNNIYLFYERNYFIIKTLYNNIIIKLVERFVHIVSKVTSFKLDVELVKQLKIRAIEEETTATDLLEQYIKKGLKEEKENEIIEDKPNLMDLVGIGTSETPTNAVQLKKELYQ